MVVEPELRFVSLGAWEPLNLVAEKDAATGASLSADISRIYCAFCFTVAVEWHYEASSQLCQNVYLYIDRRELEEVHNRQQI